MTVKKSIILNELDKGGYIKVNRYNAMWLYSNDDVRIGTVMYKTFSKLEPDIQLASVDECFRYYTMNRGERQ